MSNSLPIPESAQRDSRSVEMVRAWIAEGDLLVVLNVGYWEKPERGIDERQAWGLMMADMARHIAKAHEEKYGRKIRDSLAVIREAFEREMIKPTSSHSGQFADD
jgi:hypothetical protein